MFIYSGALGKVSQDTGGLRLLMLTVQGCTRTCLTQWKPPFFPMTFAVHSHIMKAGTFYSKHKYGNLIKSCPWDGYRALKLIIMRPHIKFIEEPAQYLMEYPKQTKDESVSHFTQVFLDFLQLQSFVIDSIILQPIYSNICNRSTATTMLTAATCRISCSSGFIISSL